MHDHDTWYDPRCLDCQLEDEQIRVEIGPTEDQVNDWNIHNDHAEGNEEEPF